MARKRVDARAGLIQGYSSPLVESGTAGSKAWGDMTDSEKQDQLDVYARTVGQGPQIAELGQGLTRGTPLVEGVLDRMMPIMPRIETDAERIRRKIQEDQQAFGIDTSLRGKSFVDNIEIEGQTKHMRKGSRAGYKGRPGKRKPQNSLHMFHTLVIDSQGSRYYPEGSDEAPKD